MAAGSTSSLSVKLSQHVSIEGARVYILCIQFLHLFVGFLKLLLSRPVLACVAPILVRVVPGEEEADVDVGAAAPADGATATQATTATHPPEGPGGEADAHDVKEKAAAQDEAQSLAGGGRGLMGLGRRRNR